MAAIERIVIVGFSGTGKSTVARLVADELGLDLVDTDLEIEASFGRPIPAIFASDGERAFRGREREVLTGALGRSRVVIATGGGAVVDPGLWTDGPLRATGVLTVALDAEPQTIVRRLDAQRAADGDRVGRPLLAVADPLAQVTDLKATRQTVYDRADITLIVDAIAADDVAREIANLVRPAEGTAPQVTLAVGASQSSIAIYPGVLAAVGELARRRWPTAVRAWVVTDRHVGALHADAIVTALERERFVVHLCEVPPGEGSKSLATVGDLYDWLLGGGVERGDVCIAFGGGVVGDLAGFVAATCLRGIGLVQVPTSLLAMVDSSVGGKTGINHAVGKNLIGAFYQPPVVVIDPALLATLPPRERRSGWAEIVKHAVIQPSCPGGERADLLRFLERNRDRLSSLAEPATSYLIQRNVALKAAVVEIDEREAGPRAMLNFGHTLGHGIEAAGYAYLHGEAVAVGMRAAARIGAAVGTCTDATVAEIDAALDRFDLLRTVAIEPDRVVALVAHDKKRVAGRQRWILPATGGGVVMRDDIPEAVARQALAAVVDA